MDNERDFIKLVHHALKEDTPPEEKILASLAVFSLVREGVQESDLEFLPEESRETALNMLRNQRAYSAEAIHQFTGLDITTIEMYITMLEAQGLVESHTHG